VNLLLFVVLPYAAALLCLAGSVERYRRHPYSVTSHSSQFLEGRRHFWALMPFHLGILSVFLAHVVWFAFPGSVLRWNASPVRLYAVEVIVLACALTAAIGYLRAGLRRATDARLRVVTSAADWIVYALLLAQIVLGIVVAVRYTWGSGWFVSVAAPYLWSLLRLSPDPSTVAALPSAIRAHLVLAWLLLAVFPFSRLVHVLSVPNAYLWRRPQVVRWRRPKAEGRRSNDLFKGARS
jgi:nitrate reductase gamma subunit